MSLQSQLIQSLSVKHPRPDKALFTYGTAGFRMNADLLDSVMYRVGLLAVLRSKSLDSKVIGAMVTASHNPEEDNGVKLVDPMGEMLMSSWEVYATNLANSETDSELISALEEIIHKERINLTLKGNVVIGRDTRISGPFLVQALKDGIQAMEGSFTDYNLLSTPQLHYITRCLNTLNTPQSYGIPTETGYYQKIGVAFQKFAKGKSSNTTLLIDAANGIGALKMKELVNVIGPSLLPVTIVNDDVQSKGKLNHNCGADFVKLHQMKPEGMDLKPGDRACSFDGDADRIVYYYIGMDHVFHLLDGDKIATLVAAYIIELVRDSGIQELNVGVVQTAYANGSSTKFITEGQKIPVSCVETGVKHLHHEAMKFDVGVYFEANGHGTVLFSPKALQIISEANPTQQSQKVRLEEFKNLIDVINQTVGDALSDLLLVEGVLMSRNWNLEKWDQGYQDLPSRQVKVKVTNRAMFKCTQADTVLVSPEGLQTQMNTLIQKTPLGRCFVRPSGTEDVVRVYAEASTRQDCDKLAYTISGLIWKDFGGVGDKPIEFIF